MKLQLAITGTSASTLIRYLGRYMYNVDGLSQSKTRDGEVGTEQPRSVQYLDTDGAGPSSSALTGSDWAQLNAAEQVTY